MDSPSKVTMEMGENITAGFMKGILKDISGLETSFNTMIAPVMASPIVSVLSPSAVGGDTINDNSLNFGDFSGMPTDDTDGFFSEFDNRLRLAQGIRRG